jgi:hypothetical protein
MILVLLSLNCTSITHRTNQIGQKLVFSKTRGVRASSKGSTYIGAILRKAYSIFEFINM